jgi:transposase-like protein
VAIKLNDPIFINEAKALAYFEEIRWLHGPVCPHCGNADRRRIYAIAANPKHKVRAGLRECLDCHGQFTVRTGTVMESSHVPLTKWALAYRLMASAKKGISAHQLHRTIGVTYKTAWFMAHRIREAMRDVSGDKLGGNGKIVEADEVYIGGKPRKGGPDGNRTMRDRKTPVAVLVERGGRVRAVPMSSPVRDRDLRENIVASVEPGTHIHSDEHKAYKNIGFFIDGRHSAVRHTDKEFARDGVHVNTAESWNGLLKRSIIGSFHHVSREHLARYCDEVAFRWNRRSIDDTERAAQAIKAGDGKRLTYRQPRQA